MNTPNKNQKLKNAIKDVNHSDSIDEILAYIAVDDRPDVRDAAKLRVAELDINHPFIQQAPPDNAPGIAPSGGAASPVTGIVPKQEEFMPTHDKDTTKEWIDTLGNLQPKQGQVARISDGSQNTGLKGGIVRKAVARKNLTIRDGKPQWILFDEDGKEIGTEQVPGH